MALRSPGHHNRMIVDPSPTGPTIYTLGDNKPYAGESLLVDALVFSCSL